MTSLKMLPLGHHLLQRSNGNSLRISNPEMYAASLRWVSGKAFHLSVNASLMNVMDACYNVGSVHLGAERCALIHQQLSQEEMNG